MNISRYAIEWYRQLSSDTAGSSLSAHKELSFDELTSSCSTIS